MTEAMKQQRSLQETNNAYNKGLTATVLPLLFSIGHHQSQFKSKEALPS